MKQLLNMNVKFSTNFYALLNEIVIFIAKDKPIAAKNFKKSLLASVKKDLQQPFLFKKSIYFDNPHYRDYVYKGYTISYAVFEEDQTVNVFGIIKNKFSY